MERGLLPPHYLSASPDEDLAAYVDTYLSEEIAAEGLARNLPAFARFLQVAASTNARMINYTNVASDSMVPRQTVKLWYEILVDTLLGFELAPFTRTVKRKSVETAKFYLFDLGVVRTLRRLPPIAPESADFGEFFEHFIFPQLPTWIDYRRPRNYGRSRGLALEGFPGGNRGLMLPNRPPNAGPATNPRPMAALIRPNAVARL